MRRDRDDFLPDMFVPPATSAAGPAVFATARTLPSPLSRVAAIVGPFSANAVVEGLRSRCPSPEVHRRPRPWNRGPGGLHHPRAVEHDPLRRRSPRVQAPPRGPSSGRGRPWAGHPVTVLDEPNPTGPPLSADVAPASPSPPPPGPTPANTTSSSEHNLGRGIKTADMGHRPRPLKGATPAARVVAQGTPRDVRPERPGSHHRRLPPSVAPGLQ